MTTSKTPFDPKSSPLPSKITLPLLPLSQQPLPQPLQPSSSPSRNVQALQELLTDSSPTDFITAYGPKLNISITFPPGNGRTKQSHKDECDINQIMARYQKTGVLDFAAQRQGQYGDATGIEFQRSMELVREAKTMFEELPASVRARFHNEPGEFLDFVHNPENRSEMLKMGLLKPEAKVAPTPQPAPVRAAAAPGEAPAGPKQGSEGGKPPAPKP